MPGDVVTLRQAIPYKPTMIVVKKETKIINPRKSAGIEGFTGEKKIALKELNVDGSHQLVNYKKQYLTQRI